MKVPINVLCLLLIFTLPSCKKNNYNSKALEKPAVAVEVAPAEAPVPSSVQSSRELEFSGNSEGIMMDSDGSKLGNESKPEEKSNSTSDHSPKTEKSIKIIKDGYMELEVKEIEKVKSSIDTVLKKYNAYYENDQFNNSEYQSSYNLKIRINATAFDKMISNIMAIDGIVKSKNINTKDVTEEYYDTEARLNSSKKYLARYYDLLGKAKSIKDIMDIEERIQSIQIEIDSYEGRLKYLSDQISYSTLNLTLTENYEHYNQTTKEHFGKKIVNAFKQGGDILLSTLLVLIKFWPFILVLGAVLIYRRRILARFRK